MGSDLGRLSWAQQSPGATGPRASLSIRVMWPRESEGQSEVTCQAGPAWAGSQVSDAGPSALHWPQHPGLGQHRARGTLSWAWGLECGVAAGDGNLRTPLALQGDVGVESR